MQITPLGDSALIIRLRDELEGPSENALDEVLVLHDRIKRAQIPGIIELASAYTTVALFFNPLNVIAAGAEPHRIFAWLEEQIDRAVADGDGRAKRGSPSVVEIPVCYEEGFALDLDEVSKHVGLLPKDVVDLHCGTEYRVNCLGFMPGFPYLSGLPSQLATPRRAVPRKDVPAGSV
ncbi:MAG TPA: carboxyltransferase domain-containing protein, partial [Chthoniobacterales bacterium]|nr:carboxyltransferase domain-containing protein [Chthoniobacterales bacterium]